MGAFILDLLTPECPKSLLAPGIAHLWLFKKYVDNLNGPEFILENLKTSRFRKAYLLVPKKLIYHIFLDLTDLFLIALSYK